MKDAEVCFKHYGFEFPDHILSRYGARYYPRKEAGQHLLGWLRSLQLQPRFQTRLSFAPDQLTCANEVFPEAALADPIADLEIWNEWRTGLRRFPYPGIYTRLNICHQESKTSATSSVGAIGEVLAGLLAQSYVAPTVVVRPIRRWPDFIFLGRDASYSFVESKASVQLEEPKPRIMNAAGKLLMEGLVDAVQELTAEPLVRVWLAFTDVIRIEPLAINVTIFEITSPALRRDNRPHNVPEAVVDGLALRLLMERAADHEARVVGRLEGADSDLTEEELTEFWKTVKQDAAASLENRIQDLVPTGTLDVAAAEIRQRIRGFKPRKLSLARVVGPGAAQAKREAAAGLLAQLRCIEQPDRWLVMADLSRSRLAQVCDAWNPDWSAANRPFGFLPGGNPLWRCSSAALSVASKSVVGKPLEGALGPALLAPVT